MMAVTLAELMDWRKVMIDDGIVLGCKVTDIDMKHLAIGIVRSIEQAQLDQFMKDLERNVSTESECQ